VNTPPPTAPVAAAPVVATNEKIIYEGQPSLVTSLWVLLISIFTAGIALAYFAIKKKSTSYKITTQRIVIDTGIFSKHLEQVDLYRVNDFQVDRPFAQRLLGTGNIRMQTFDKTTPEVVLFGIRGDVVAIYESIRAAVEAAKAARGVRVIDYE
jgi:uncharacterized membrane protein YdbT with pleckstrin-like domain